METQSEKCAEKAVELFDLLQEIDTVSFLTDPDVRRRVNVLLAHFSDAEFAQFCAAYARAMNMFRT